MVDIIPYEENDDDSSDWIPLTAPDINNLKISLTLETSDGALVGQTDSYRCGTDRNLQESSRNGSQRMLSEKGEGSSDFQDMLSSPLGHIGELKNVGSQPESMSTLEKQIISHLTTSAATARNASSTDDEGYSSENDEGIVWIKANEVIADEKIFFKPSVSDVTSWSVAGNSVDKTRQGVTNSTRTSTSKYVSLASDESLPQTISNDCRDQRRQHQDCDSNNPTQYRQAVKHKLQQSLIYDPMKSLPWCFLRHLYKEGKLELSLVWSTSLEENGGKTKISFFILMAIFGIVLIGSGAFGILSIAIPALYNVGSSLFKFMMWHALSIYAQLTMLFVTLMTVLAILMWVSVHSKADIAAGPTGGSFNDGASRSILHMPEISALVPWAVALTSPSMCELIVVVFSLQAIFSPAISDDNECDVNPALSAITDSLIVLVSILITFCTVSVYASYLERDQSQVSDKRQLSEDDSRSSGRRALLHLQLVKRHLNACHMIAVASLPLLVVVFFFARILYHHSGGSLFTLLAAFGSMTRNVTIFSLGVIIAEWAVRSILLLINNYDGTSRRLHYHRITRNAFKESIIEVSTNAVWSDNDRLSNLHGVLSEEDGTLRLAVLEWIVERWISASDVSQSKSCETNSPCSTSFEHQPNESAPTGQFQRSNPQNKDVIKPTLPSFEYLQKVISKLDADETLLPAIQCYREWVYSLPPPRNVAMIIAFWRMCPGIFASFLLLLWYSLVLIKTYFQTLISCLFGDEYDHSNFTTSRTLIAATSIISPLIFLEYHRVRRWWRKVASTIHENQKDEQRKVAPDSIDVMLGYDFDNLPDEKTESRPRTTKPSCHLILSLWDVLLESIIYLESSVPVVRCATVACAATSLTSNLVDLVDLAVVIKKRGLLFGIGMLIFDAFQHNLSQELRRRKQGDGDTTPDEGIRSEFADGSIGKYTRASINALGNTVKIAHNLNCLIESNRNSTIEDVVEEEVSASNLPGSQTVGIGVNLSEAQIHEINEQIDRSDAIPTVEEQCHEKLDPRPDVQNEVNLNNQNSNQAKDSNEAQHLQIGEPSENQNGLWIGGGFALVAGTVACGLAFITNMKKDGDRERKGPERKS